jgi:hypothetical protein
LKEFHGEKCTKTTVAKTERGTVNKCALSCRFWHGEYYYLKVVDGLQGVDAGNAAILETKQQVLHSKGCVLSKLKGRV